MLSLNKNVAEGLMNPKTVGVDQRVGQGQSQLGAALGENAVAAQQAAFDEYLRAARGQAPSAAQLQQQAGLEQAQRAAMDMAGRTRGGNLGGAYTAALSAQSGAMAQANQAAAALRAAEMEQARAGLAGLGGQMAAQQFGYEQLANNTTLGLRGQDLNYNLGNAQLQQQKEQADRAFMMQLINQGVSAVGSMAEGIAGMSDERAKIGLRMAGGGAIGAMRGWSGQGPLPPRSEASEAVGEVMPAMWDSYKPGLGPPGERLGVSAQQLEGTRLGGLVFTGPDGLKRVDGVGAGMAGLAASAEQEHRIRALEAQMARTDPYASPESQRNADEYDARYGPAREAEAAKLSAEIRAARQQAFAPKPYDFGGAPQMYRGRDPGGAQAIEPFSTRGAPSGGVANPFAGDPPQDAALKAYLDAPAPGRSSPSRPASQRMSSDPWAGGAMPIAAPPANASRAAPAAPWMGDGRAVPIPIRPPDQEPPPPPPMTPQQQAIVDAFWQEMDRWGARDEAGNWMAGATRRPELPYTRGEARAIQEFDDMDREQAIARELARLRAEAARQPRAREGMML